MPRSNHRFFCKTIVMVIFVILMGEISIAQDFWRNVYQSSSVSFNCVNTNSKNILFAGSSAGIIKSPDNGISWSSFFIPQQEILTLVVNQAGEIYAGTNGNGIFKSADNGDTWKSIGLAGIEVPSIAVQPNGNILAGTKYGGIFKSTNDGQNWTGLTGPATYITTILADTGGIIYAGSVSGIYKSTNNGSSWTDINSGIYDGYISSIIADTNGTLYLATRTEGIYKSTNQGTNWYAIRSGLASHNTSSIVINSLGHLYTSTRDSGVYRSMDNGDSWKEINTGLTGKIIRALAININGYVFAINSQGMIYRSEKSTTGGIKVSEPALSQPPDKSLGISNNLSLQWKPSYGAVFYTCQLSKDSLFGSAGLTQKDVTDTTFFISGLEYSTTYYWRVSASSYDNQSKWSNTFSFTTESAPPKFWQFISGPLKSNAIFINKKNQIFVGTKVDGIYRSADNGRSWSNVYPYSCVTYCFAMDSNNVLYAGIGPGGMVYSNDNGVTWNPTDFAQEDIHSILVTPKKTILIGSVGKFFRSTNGGASWVSGMITPWTVSSLVYNPVNTYVFASTRWDGVFISKDDGITWERVGLKDHAIRNMVINSKGTLFAASEDSGVYCSTNNGNNWSRVFNYTSTSTKYLTSITVSTNDNLYFSTSMEGVYRSTNNGLTWTQVNLGLAEDSYLYAVSIDPDGYLYTGAYQYGIYKSIKATTVSVKNLTTIKPDKFLLEQNFPNPFNSTTTIRYSLPADNHVEIKIYDMLGKEVTTLVNDRQIAGKYEIKFEADNLTSGVYFYSIRAGNLYDSKKLMLLK
jgi:photosystem II stability/assembly factor-like uncharacterized protein